MSAVAGTIPALITPFTDGGAAVDLDALDAHIEWLHVRGIRCIVPLGTTGEGPSLGPAERRAVIERVAAHPSGMAFVAGTGCVSLPETVELSRHALDHGAAAVLVAPPWYFTPEADGLERYYAALLEQLPESARVILYHIPGYTGVPIEVDLVVALRERFGARIVGVKDSGGRLEHSAALLEAVPDLVVLCGSDALVADAYRAGAAGIVSGLANAAPRQVDAIRRAVAAGGDGAEEQAWLTALRDLTHAVPGRSALKVLVAHACGLPRSPVRPPLTDLDDAAADELCKRFEALVLTAAPARGGAA
jgi:4-hydroxy-tetrahydrodipicolinate synthase